MAVIRKYHSSDYPACEALASNAWAFEKNFTPRAFAGLVAYLYAMGSVLESNFKMVVEDNNEVVGFLFAFNENAARPQSAMQNFFWQISILIRLLFIKGLSLRDKIALIKATTRHERNKAKLIQGVKSELVHFVIAPAYQGKGYGRQLINKFIAHCEASGVKSMIVETNKLGASGFYEKMGFLHKGDFDSPLHEYSIKNGQACLYEYFLRR